MRAQRRQTILTLLLLWLVAATGCAQTLTLVTTNTIWRYNKSGANLGATWTTPGYDDTIAGWEGPGRMLFGAETTPSVYLPFSFNTIFPDPSTQSPFVTNYYFRTHFTVPNLTPAALTAT